MWIVIGEGYVIVGIFDIVSLFLVIVVDIDNQCIVYYVFFLECVQKLFDVLVKLSDVGVIQFC